MSPSRLASLAVLGLLACGDSSVTGSRPAAAITVNPPSALMLVGGSLSLGAKVTNEAGETVDTLVVHWSSSDATIASVSENGVVTAHRPGEVRIAATTFGRSAVATVRVSNPSAAAPPASQTPPQSPPQAPPSQPPAQSPPTAPPAVASIAISLSSATLKVGSTANATAVLRSANGTILTGRTVTWTSSASSIATVSASGSVVAKKQGRTTITATSEGRTATVVLNVEKR
jgi:trimeric autotransporter adhesin